MKLYSVALALATCLSMAAAQGLDGLPDCAVSVASHLCVQNATELFLLCREIDTHY
jgi:hypothetical protein